MTLTQALLLARSRPGTDTLAVWVRETLSESQPCTLEAPVADPGNHVVAIMDGESPLYEFDPGEARAYAAMLLRAADEAEGPR